MDMEAIKKALDKFEEDKFTDAKDILSAEIKAAKYDFLEKKLGLKNPIEPKPEVDANAEPGEGDQTTDGDE